MFGWFKRKPVLKAVTNTGFIVPVGENTMKAYTSPVGDRTGLFYTNDTLITTYARERDAVRGAARRGLTLINATA